MVLRRLTKENLKTWKASERDAREYFNYSLESASSSKIGDLVYCEGLARDRWIRGLGQQKSKKLMLGARVHTVCFWFYEVFATSEGEILAGVANLVKEGKEQEIYDLFLQIINEMLPEGMDSEDILRLKQFASHEKDRLFWLHEFIGNMTAELIRKYFVPVAYEEAFYIEELDEHGTVDATFLLPPGFEFEGKLVKYMQLDFKTQLASDIRKQMEANEKLDPFHKKKLDMPSRYRRQFVPYDDFVVAKFGVNRDEILNYLLVLLTDQHVPIAELPKKRSETAWRKQCKRWKKKVELWKNEETRSQAFSVKPYHKKCRKCSNEETCEDWNATKRPFPFEVDK